MSDQERGCQLAVAQEFIELNHWFGNVYDVNATGRFNDECAY